MSERKIPRFAAPAVEIEHLGEGGMILRSPRPLGATARSLGEKLAQWASFMPHRVFLAERAGADWRRVTYRRSSTAGSGRTGR